MIDPATAFTLFDKVRSVIQQIVDGKRERSKQTDLALLALYNALSETKAYLQQRKAGSPRDIKTEFAVAKLWNMASLPLRELDPELADKCFLKGGYWMEPDAWTDERVKQSGIAVEQVFEQTREFLRGD